MYKRHVFQFQYGAIGRLFDLDEIINFQSFNSSMVRLGDVEKGSSPEPVLFQFQYGAIGSLNQVTGPVLFQFQYGAIGRNG